MDTELAADVREAEIALTQRILEAWKAGLKVDVEIEHIRQLGNSHALPLLTVRVYRPL